MKATSKKILIALAGLGSIFLFGLAASAECGVYNPPAPHKSSWQPQAIAPQFLLAAAQPSAEPTMVGVWKEHWISEGSEGIDNGTEVDASYAAWHSDGTEINISGLRAPMTGNVCMGVWEKTGSRTYKLNHFGISYDSTGLNLVGAARIQQNLTLDPDGNKISGTFTIDQYDESGNKLAHVQGKIYGTRVTIDTGWERVE